MMDQFSLNRLVAKYIFLRFDLKYAALAVYRIDCSYYCCIFYATFLDEIDKIAESSLISLAEQTSPPREESSLSDSNISSTWAEVSLFLDTEIEERLCTLFS